MSYKQMTGNIISATKVEPDGVFTSSAASGVWSLQEQYDYVRGGNWPNAANATPIGLFGGGELSSGASTDTIQYVNITSAGNAIDFGDRTVSTLALSAFGSSTRAVFVGGQNSGGDEAIKNVYDYVTIASTGNATDFGDMDGNAAKDGTAFSSNTRGIYSGGRRNADSNQIEYVTIASTGNATDFGNLTQGRSSIAGCSSPTRGLTAGGGGGGDYNIIDYVTIASAGNASDFGDLLATTSGRNQGSVCSNTRGIFAGQPGSNVDRIQYVTIASTGNAQDFGNLIDTTNHYYSFGSASGPTLGIFAGNNSVQNVIQQITIASTGNASDFGDLTLALKNLAGCSGSHGGIAA